MHQYFESRLHRALAWYALVPVLVMTLLGALLMLGSWQHYVVGANDAARGLAAEIFRDVASEFAARAEDEGAFLGREDFSQLRHPGGKRSEAYTRLYHDTGHRAVDFYLVDRQGSLVLGSREVLPDYLLRVEEGWGIQSRLLHEPKVTRQEFLPGEKGQDLICGRAVGDGGEVKGFLFYVLPAPYLMQLAGDSRADIALVDGLDNVRLWQGPEALLDFRKLKGDFLQEERGLVTLEKEVYYVTGQQTDLAGVPYRVYAISRVSDLFTRYAIGAGALLLAVLLMIPLLLRSIARESRLTAQAVDDQTAIAQLKELESQFNPHFLFNTLENIKFMVRLDPGAATEMIMALSALLRYSISSGGRQAELREDLKYLESYMKIQKYRFGSRLDFASDIDARALGVYIPKLLFQPLLENAIKYGEDEKGQMRIEFRVALQEGCLHILVKDRGRGMEPGKLQGLEELLASGDNNTGHRGLFNVQRRVQLLYGEEYGLKIACPAEGGTEISLELPGNLQRIETADN